jgi:hypothetical protein
VAAGADARAHVADTPDGATLLAGAAIAVAWIVGGLAALFRPGVAVAVFAAAAGVAVGWDDPWLDGLFTAGALSLAFAGACAVARGRRKPAAE